MCYKVNLPSCVARQPLCHKVNLPRCEARRRHFIMTCDIFGTGQTNTLCYLLGKCINQPTVAPLLSHWNQHARPNYWKSYWRELHIHSIEGFDKVCAKFEFMWKLLKQSIQFNSFCQQVDDWMLLKITEKIIRRNVFKERKRIPGLALIGLWATAPCNHASKTKCSIYTPDALWPMSPSITSTWHRTIQYLLKTFL